MLDILLALMGVILGVGGVGAAIKGTFTYTQVNYRGESIGERTVPIRAGGIAAVVLGGLFVLLSSMYTQDTGEAVVIKSAGGGVANIDTTPGFGFTAPWNSRISFDVRNQKIEMFSNKDGDGDDGAAISSPTREGTNVGVSITIRYSIRPDCVEDLYREYKSNDNLRDRALEPGLRDATRVATANYSVFSVKQRRADVVTDIIDDLEARWEDLCVTVDDVNLGDLKLDQTTEDALVRINESQAAVEEARSDFEAAQVRAETVKVNAQASADADQITRCGATTTTEVREVAGEETEVEVVTPVPIRECRNLLNEQVILNNYIDALEEIGAAGNLIVVDSDVQSILDITQPQG